MSDSHWSNLCHGNTWSQPKQGKCVKVYNIFTNKLAVVIININIKALLHWPRERAANGLESRQLFCTTRNLEKFEHGPYPDVVGDIAPYKVQMMVSWTTTLRCLQCPTEGRYSQIGKSCRSWLSWHCRKPPGSDWLVVVAAPTHPGKHNNYLVTSGHTQCQQHTSSFSHLFFGN